MSDLQILQIEKQYPYTKQHENTAFSLQAVKLTIHEGEFFSLLGPSGCGKTTLLKLVAGLLAPDNGEIWMGERNLTTVPAETRQFAMVFQQSLLFPHMNVEDNVAFGLKMQKVSKKIRLAKAHDMLERVGLNGYGTRFPDVLSGGQQQRVALARALVTQPSVLLMDEPFSALDPSLREEMRELLSRIQQEFQVTVLFVTHDREEAFYLSDRIAVMSDGEILQVGKAKELYERPETTKVALFLGLKNSVNGIVENGQFICSEKQFNFSIDTTTPPGQSQLILRPETFQLVTKESVISPDGICLRGTVNEIRFSHGFYVVNIQTAEYYLECNLNSQQASHITVGQEISFGIDVKDLWVIQNK
ncbi:ABC transporter ATP-binding protein [Planococcus versutus]|uniref:Carnitine transport ATP-binding protein OpuCA n=1 Tax=Planococcus versutus TaxID=1302659 RepID=A0A1B1S5P6_9BACL|nr:ABC transporter ATP-binding protein [Planococcus versutus]ANU28505.1 ABC transporter [Planococcus versutus]